MTEEFKNIRAVVTYKSKLRTLKQYKNMSDQEFEEAVAKKSIGLVSDKFWEERIQKKIDEFSSDYDLDDLKINDIYSLKALAAAIIRLQDYDNLLGQIQAEGINIDNIILIDKIQKIQTDLRRDISNLQNDLKITRRVRKSEKEESVINFIEDLKVKARKFYQQKMHYVFCPECDTLLFTGWFLFPDKEGNSVVLKCSRKMPDGHICGGTIQISSKKLLERGGTNNPELLPESMK